MDDQPIDVNLLKRMMMGDFSSDSSGRVSPKDASNKATAKRKIEFDLHYEKLFPNGVNVEYNQRLKLQLEALDDFILDARKASVRSAYIIVGKGDGVLKAAVKKQLVQKKITHSEVADPPYFGNAFKLAF